MHAGTHSHASTYKNTHAVHICMHSHTHTHADAHNVKGDEAYKSVDLKLLLSDPKVFHNFVVALN